LDLVGRVAEIWRYPVSSVGGERITRAELSAVGMEGDRQFGLIDTETGKPAAPERDHSQPTKSVETEQSPYRV
jgi:uncharacterized protein YcbX